MELEHHQSHGAINTSCYRATAIQNITLGGDLSYSLELMNAARRYEGKKFNDYEFVSPHRTDEIIHRISSRREHPVETLNRIMHDQEEKKSLEEAIRKGDVSSLLKCKRLNT